MNKKEILTKENIELVANWLKVACDDFANNDANGCYNYHLSDDLVLAVGWSYGYDMADEDIIKSYEGRQQNGDWTCGWAVNAAIKVRNDFDCADFDFLHYPYYEDGECWDSGISIQPNLKRRDYKRLARWFLENFVNITNAHAKGEVQYA